MGNLSNELEAIMFQERTTRNRYSFDNLENSTRVLGFGKDGPLRLEYDTDVDEEFIENAWRDVLKRARKDMSAAGTETINNVNEAFCRIAESRGSVQLHQKWEQARDGVMTPEQACTTLGADDITTLDDGFLITLYSLRVCAVQNIRVACLTMIPGRRQSI